MVRFVGIPARTGTANGAHGVNFGMKAGGGYYAHVASQFSNMLTVLDLDPNGDHSATDAAVAGRILLANGQPGGTGVTDGVGGQGVKPLPTPYDGWIQDTVAAQAQPTRRCAAGSPPSPPANAIRRRPGGGPRRPSPSGRRRHRPAEPAPPVLPRRVIKEMPTMRARPALTVLIAAAALGVLGPSALALYPS